MSDTWFLGKNKFYTPGINFQRWIFMEDAFQTSDCDQLVIQSVTKKVGDKFSQNMEALKYF